MLQTSFMTTSSTTPIPDLITQPQDKLTLALLAAHVNLTEGTMARSVRGWREHQDASNGTDIPRRLMELIISEYKECVEVTKETIQKDMFDALYDARVLVHVSAYQKELNNLTAELNLTVTALNDNRTYHELLEEARLA